MSFSFHQHSSFLANLIWSDQTRGSERSAAAVLEIFMTSRRAIHTLIVAAGLIAAVRERSGIGALSAAEHPDLSGRWTLNGGQSDMPAEVGFDPDWQDSESKSGARSSSGGGGGGGGGGRSGGGRGGSRSAGGGGTSSGGAIATNFESEEDS